MLRRDITYIRLFFLLAVAFFPGCGQKPQEQELTSITIAFQEWVGHGLFYLAQEKGFCKEETANVFPDYCGKQALGAREFIPRMEWGVLARIDTKEAFTPLAKLRLVFFMILFIAVIAILLLSMYIAKFIAGPLHRPHKGTEIIGSGNLDYKVGTDAKDEVGLLSHAFDVMTENLKNTTTSIERLNKKAVERKWAELVAKEAREYAESITETVREPLIVLDAALKVISANHSFYQTFKVNPEETKGRFIYDLGNRQWDIPKLRTLLEDILPRNSAFDNYEIEHDFKTIGPKIMLLNARRIYSEADKTQMILLAIEDITARKKAEKEMKEAVEMKAKFVSTASHELRTPLTAIKEGINLVHSEMTGPLNDNQKEFLGIAKRNVDRLARLINDVLDFQKICAGRMAFNMKPASINEAVTLVEETMRPLAKEKGLDFIIEFDQAVPAVNFDKDKIIQVLTNLVNNAIRFTETGSIKITTSRHEDNILVSIQDSGCGIKKEDIPRLFQEFEQLATKDSERKTGGTGLGLAISKKIIENHSGKIWAESDYGKGTTFYFKLPVEAIPCQIKY